MSARAEDRQAVVVVVGLAPRVGATTVARTLALALSARAAGTAIVLGDAAPARRAFATTGAARLARAGGAVAGRPAIVAGRLVLLPGSAAEAPIVARLAALAPVIVDAGRTAPGVALLDAAAAIAVVAGAGADPALVAAASAALVPARGRAPVVVVNRCADPAGEVGAGAVATPPAPVGARLARRGLRAGGRLGRSLAAAVDELADAA